MHPLIEEICRAKDVQPHAFRRWQQELRQTIQPMLDDLERRKAEEAADSTAPARKAAR